MDSEPELDAEVVWFIQAFYQLGASRPLGYGVLGSIPLSEMVVYWNHVGRIGPIDEFIDVIQMLDAEFLSTINGQGLRNKDSHNRR